MRRLILLILCATNFVYAQTEDPLKKERDDLVIEKQKNAAWEKELNTALAQAESDIKNSRAEIEKLNEFIKNKPAYVTKAIQQANDALDGLSTADRLISRKSGFLKCIRNDLKDRGITNVKNCRLAHPAKFTKEDEVLIKEWTDTVSLSPSDINFKRDKILRDLQVSQTKIEISKKQLGYAASQTQRLLDSEKSINLKEIDQKLSQASAKYTNCDANTPEISLEEKAPYPGAKFQGPFYGVPRDNQDGLGTCYANTAKNLLVGTSQGKDVASFLDMALLFKGDSGVISSGLDAGYSCGVLSKMQEVGYCPQEFAPFETGEKNIFAESLMGGNKGTVYDQSIIVGLLQRFLAGQEELVKDNKDLSVQMLKQAKAIIHNIKARPNVKIPMPVVRTPIPTAWKLHELSSLKSKKDQSFSQDKMLSDYKKEYRKFYPEYIRGVMEGQTRDQIFDTFQVKMKSFIDKYQIADQMKQWKAIFLEDTENDWTDPNLNKEIANSLSFMKAMSGKQGSSNEEFLKFCDETSGDSFEFLNTLQPLVKHLKELNVDTDVLFDKKGNFKSASDLMQLAVAPACLKSENRKKPEHGILCESGYDTISKIRSSGKNSQDQKRMFRDRVVVSLIQGYPLGNTFGRHINTIVGMKYNPASKECEFRIRESQNGTSFWQSEQRTFSQIEALTEVRRK